MKVEILAPLLFFPLVSLTEDMNVGIVRILSKMQFTLLINFLVSTACLTVAVTVPSKNLEKPSVVLLPGAWHSPEH